MRCWSSVSTRRKHHYHQFAKLNIPKVSKCGAIFNLDSCTSTNINANKGSYFHKPRVGNVASSGKSCNLRGWWQCDKGWGVGFTTTKGVRSCKTIVLPQSSQNIFQQLHLSEISRMKTHGHRDKLWDKSSLGELLHSGWQHRWNYPAYP